MDRLFNSCSSVFMYPNISNWNLNKSLSIDEIIEISSEEIFSESNSSKSKNLNNSFSSFDKNDNNKNLKSNFLFLNENNENLDDYYENFYENQN